VRRQDWTRDGRQEEASSGKAGGGGAMHDRRHDNATATIASKLIRQDLRTVPGNNHKQIRKQVRSRGKAPLEPRHSSGMLYFRLV
jgi:hypothetical protein